MRYIVCEKPGQFLLKDKPKPQPSANEVLLKINQVGICGTDLHAYSGNQAFFQYPRILGHELAGEIVSLPNNKSVFKVGENVIIMPYLSCGNCFACRNGKTNCCSKIQVLGVHTDGGMQEYITLPIDTLMKADGLAPSSIALVEPLAIGAHAIRRAMLNAKEYVVVVGCGPIGLGIMKLAQLAGAQVIAMDVNEERLNFAKDALDIQWTINALTHPVETLKEITHGDLAAAVFDATGNPKALETGTNYMSHGGRYILVGLSKGPLTFNHPAIHAKESSILCSRNATKEDFIQVKEILQSGQFPSNKFITHRVHFTEMIDHFEQWNSKNDVIKAMVSF